MNTTLTHKYNSPCTVSLFCRTQTGSKRISHGARQYYDFTFKLKKKKKKVSNPMQESKRSGGEFKFIQPQKYGTTEEVSRRYSFNNLRKVFKSKKVQGELSFTRNSRRSLTVECSLAPFFSWSVGI